jgi:hypothetical protein
MHHNKHRFLNLNIDTQYGRLNNVYKNFARTLKEKTEYRQAKFWKGAVKKHVKMQERKSTQRSFWRMH